MGNIEAQKERPELSKGRRYVYAGIFWFFAIGTLFTGFFVSWYGTLLPLFIANMLHRYLIKRKNIAIFPYQGQLTAWLYTTRIYDRFVRRVKVDKEARSRRFFGFMMLIGGVTFLGFYYSQPTVDNLEDMPIVRGTYESSIQLGRKNPCGGLILTIRLENGTLAKYFDSWSEGVKELQKHKGMEVTIWERKDPKSIIPECRKYSQIAQIQSEVYERFYNKQRIETISLCFAIIGIIFTTSGLAILLIVVLLPEEITIDS
jgi:hypothetical protein